MGIFSNRRAKRKITATLSAAVVTMTALPAAAQGRPLVVYYSHTGTTEILAEKISAEHSADVFKIETVKTYPAEYKECTRVAKKEKADGFRPELKSLPENFDSYTEIYLGYPIWFGDLPPAVYTFAENMNWQGKTVRPFCTYGGGGTYKTDKKLAGICAGATVEKVRGVRASKAKKLAAAQ